MIWLYVSKSFRRRKVRTIMMLLSLIVSTGLMTVMSATVETMRLSDSALGDAMQADYDLTVRRTDTYPDPFISVTETSQRILASDARITGVYPRIEKEVELTIVGRAAPKAVAAQQEDGLHVDIQVGNTAMSYGSAGNQSKNATLIALDPSENFGHVKVISGTYQLGSMQAAVDEQAAKQLGIGVGDTVEILYAFPEPREIGSIGAAGSSQRRAVGQFTVSAIVRQAKLVDEGTNNPILVHIHDAQEFLHLPDQAQMLAVTVDPTLYKASNARQVSLDVRSVALGVQAALGNDYVYDMAKALHLESMAMGFMLLHAMITVYGLMSLGVVSLLLHTLVMTNVREQRREMAVLRILGSRRKLLFRIVIAEVLMVGLVGVGLGVLLGQAITAYVLVPLIQSQFDESLMAVTLTPTVSLASVLPVVGSALVVLILSALKPAQDAASTKVVHAINPSVADNIQIEDLAQLRERSPNLKLFIIGIALLLVVGMMFGLMMVENLGNDMVYAALFLMIIILMVAGFVLVFFMFTRPLEKLVILLTRLVWPRLTYFGEKNVGRSRQRNTLISLMVLVSGVLPSFLATQMAISYANIETDVRLNVGAPAKVRAILPWELPADLRQLYLFKPSFVSQELGAIKGVDQMVGVTPGFGAQITDAIGVRGGDAQVVGVTGDLGQVLYHDMMVFTEGGPESLARLADDPHAIIISEGMAKGLAVPLGARLKLTGAGVDHEREMIVVGIVQRLPGFSGMGRITAQSMNGGKALVSLEAFRELSTDPTHSLPDPDAPALESVLAMIDPGVEPVDIETAIMRTLQPTHNLGSQFTDLRVERVYSDSKESQLWLIVLTLVSFITAVFGVFAVIYITIYSRRLEIGMLKAIGARKREINGMLSIESISMALGAALTGILSGASMAYLFSYVESAMAQRPYRFTVDTTVMPFVVVLVTLAALVGTLLSARRMIKRRAVEILRMS